MNCGVLYTTAAVLVQVVAGSSSPGTPSSANPIVVSSDVISRSKRGIDQFGEMITHTTKINPLFFNGYGNYCGKTRDTTKPVIDDLDRCCYHHDRCFVKVKKTSCAKFVIDYLLIRYKFKIIDGYITCGDKTGSCRKDLCLCDKVAAECFATTPYHFRRKRFHFTDLFIRQEDRRQARRFNQKMRHM